MNKKEKFDKSSQSVLNKNLIAECGLYCGSCGVYLASIENDEAKLLRYSLILKQTIQETYCEGCGSAKKSAHCTKMCTFIKCKAEKGISSCANCADFFCKDLSEFRSKMPHRIEIEESQKLLLSMDSDKWLSFHADRFRCANCNTFNSAYDLSCRNCGNIPSCQFVSEHKELIEKYLKD